MSIVSAAVCLVGIAAAWDMVRMVTRAARERVSNARIDALEAQIEKTRAVERLSKLETQIEQHAVTLRNSQKSAPVRRWGA